MDWFSWLSKTNLEPSLIYNYGLTFARNELSLQDAVHFNHEFLQSMGISIAKHRLEILQLANKESAEKPRKLAGFIKKCLRKCVRKFGLREEAEPVKGIPEPDWYHETWRNAFVRKQGNETEEINEGRPFHRTRNLALSGPLGGRMQEEVLPPDKELRLSGPIDGSLFERLKFTNRSPTMCRALDGRCQKSPMLSVSRSMGPRSTRPESPRANGNYSMAKVDFDFEDDHALWSPLFRDLKPT